MEIIPVATPDQVVPVAVAVERLIVVMAIKVVVEMPELMVE